MRPTINKNRETQLRFSRAEKAKRPTKEHIQNMLSLANQKLSNQNGRLILPSVNNW